MPGPDSTAGGLSRSLVIKYAFYERTFATVVRYNNQAIFQHASKGKTTGRPQVSVCLSVPRRVRGRWHRARGLLAERPELALRSLFRGRCQLVRLTEQRGGRVQHLVRVGFRVSVRIIFRVRG